MTGLANNKNVCVRYTMLNMSTLTTDKIQCADFILMIKNLKTWKMNTNHK